MVREQIKTSSLTIKMYIMDIFTHNHYGKQIYVQQTCKINWIITLLKIGTPKVCFKRLENLIALS